VGITRGGPREILQRVNFVRRFSVLGVVLVAVSVAGVALAASGPLPGTYSGTARRGNDGVREPPLHVSFVLKGTTVSKLTVGPATFGCEPRSESGVTPVSVRLPKLTGFPAEKLEEGPEYNYAFVRKGRRFVRDSNPLVPTGPVYFSFDGVPDGRKFGNGTETMSIYFGADPDGKLDVNGSLECQETYWNFFATRG
jgi:hypothetical protein